MIVKSAKTALFASLIVAMMLTFSSAAFAETEYKNPKDKTLERTQEKNDRDLVLQKIQKLYNEEKLLKDQLQSEDDQAEKQRINARLGQIQSELDRIDKANHANDMTQSQIDELIGHQEAFEEKLVLSNAVKFVTTVGIDVTSKEIQVGLNRDLVDSKNVDSIVSDLHKMMPADARWHFVFSDTATLMSCTQAECDPIIGGNYIRVAGMKACSFGFQAKQGSVWGWVTAGHCADNSLAQRVFDHSNENIGVVQAETFYWGTYCDCAWIGSRSDAVDNKVILDGVHTITKTTPASQQQNDMILKSGYKGGVASGTISAIHVTVINALNGEYIRGLVRSNTLVFHGDSGGTIVEFGDRGDLYGIATTHDWWGSYHTPIDRITSTLGITPILN